MHLNVKDIVLHRVVLQVGWHVRNEGDVGSSFRQKPMFWLDPFYAPDLQAKRLAEFVSCKPTYIHHVDMAWMVEQWLKVQHELEVRGIVGFLELKHSIHPRSNSRVPSELSI
ncbi:hypothetical protein Lal_00033631 [Lupinus albus]|nr:hypothetical protein Lal_00033631 [Lupinus albus]